MATDADDWTVGRVLESEVGLELLAAGWAGHQHSTNVFWESKLLPAFTALVNYALLHEILL